MVLMLRSIRPLAAGCVSKHARQIMPAVFLGREATS
jgi:hypothetical protein